MRAWCSGAWRSGAIAAALIAHSERLGAQGAVVDSTARTAPELRITTVGASPTIGILERATRDTLFVRVGALPFTILRRDITRLELRGPDIDAAERSQRRVFGVLRGGLMTTGVIAALGASPCLSPQARRGDNYFPCWTLGAIALTIGVPTTLVMAVVVGAVSSAPSQNWVPVDAAVWRISLDTRTHTHPPGARPLLSFRVAF